MALKKAGITLVAENYSAYKKTLQDINKLHQQAFSKSPLTSFNQAVSKFSSESSRMAGAAKASARSTWDLVQGLRQVASSASTATPPINSVGSILQGWAGNLGGKLKSGFFGIMNSGFTKLISKATVALAALKAMFSFAQFISGADDLAARVQTLDVSLQTLANSAGYTGDQTAYAVEQLRNQGITTKSAQQSLIRMTRANLDWSKASELAAIAQSAAVVEGRNSSELFNELIYGIQRLSPQILDNLGIQIKLGNAYEKYAASLGKSSKELTANQQQQAVLNEVIAQSTVSQDVYANAMETTGKQEQSLVRLNEEVQLSFGKVLLPLKSLNVTMKTDFVKTLSKVTTGLASWQSATQAGIDSLKSVLKVVTGIIPVMYSLLTTIGLLDGSVDVWDRLGHWIFVFGKLATYSFISLQAVMEEWFSTATMQAKALADGLIALKQGDITGFAKGLMENANAFDDFGKRFRAREDELQKAAQETNPNLTKSWAELKEEIAKVDLTKGTDGFEETNDNAEELTDTLKALKDAYSKLDNVQIKFNEGLERLNEDFNKDLIKAAQDAAKSREKIEKDRTKALAKLEADSAKQRRKLIESEGKKIVEDQKKRNRELEKEKERFELSQLQASRRFEVQDRRLRAEGDVLGLMQLREDYELSQKEAQENFDLSQKDSKENAQEQTRIQQEELQNRLKELDADIQERQSEIQSSYLDELSALSVSNREKEEAMKQSYIDRYNALVESRNKEIEQLGRSLSEEKELTKEGMDAIANEINRIFGDSEAGDALIKGWSDRTSTEFGMLVADLEEQLGEMGDTANSVIDTTIVATEEKIATATAKMKGFIESSISDLKTAGDSVTNTITDLWKNIKSPFDQLRSTLGGGGGSSNRLMPGTAPQPMAQGGSGVVTGPAHFFVEPGVKEHVSFTPLNKGSNMSHSGAINMGLNVSGMPAGLNQELEGAIINRAADMAVDEIRIAIERLKRR